MEKTLEEYVIYAGASAIDQLQQTALPLKGLKILHVNATRTGGGVAEILSGMVPLTNQLGITTQWEVMQGDHEFFQCTKSIHNGLQGAQINFTPSMQRTYEKITENNAETLGPLLNEADVVFIHDPQPAGLILHFPKRKGKWIWRCHIDARKPSRPIWKYLEKYLVHYDASIFSLAEFSHPLPHPICLVFPSIDPLSEKNIPLEISEQQMIYELFHIDPNRPLILQVSRFDRFKDPLGVIAAYKIAKKIDSSLQLVLVGGGAADDPEGEQVLNEVKQAVGEETDIHILLLPPDSPRIINAFQRSADIVLQKSIKEGFGLTVTEAMWKFKPVIGGNTGGLRVQIYNNETGYLVNTPEGAADRIRFLLQDQEKRREMGIKAHSLVQERFLITRHLREYLHLILALQSPKNDRINLNKGPYDTSP